ncbi:MAG TPA: sugar phosphate isomerase/epimerase family protein [Chloroflexota bacterium]|nr:sugar phosphate isomerase/epimerase family protein [Chloroflexota bacterium]
MKNQSSLDVSFTACMLSGRATFDKPEDGTHVASVTAMSRDDGQLWPEGFSFGVSEFTTWPWPFRQDVDHYASLGVQAMEVCEFKLRHGSYPEQLQQIVESGLLISSAQPEVRTLFPSQSQPEPKDVDQRMSRFLETIRGFGEFASGLAFVTNSGNPPNGNIQHVLDVAVDQYRRLADRASEYGARIAFEPLNPSIMNVESAVWTLTQALELAQAVDRSNFGICLDLWNVWQNAGIDETIRECGGRTFVVQVSDWRTPRSTQDRLIPGDGVIPLPTLLRAIRESGFRGAISVEIFSGEVPDSLWEGDLEEVIRQSRKGLNRAWSHNGAT